MRRCVILGAGGLGKEIAWVIRRINDHARVIKLLGFCDDAPEKQTGSFAGYALLGGLEQFAVSNAGCGFVCAIGDNRARQHATALAKASGMFPMTVIDPSALIAPDAVVGAGSYIGLGSILSVGASLGEGVLVNHQACIGHDARLGDFVQVCPGARISGGCQIGEGVLLGTNSTVIPLKKLGAWATLGAGTTALCDIPDGRTIIRLKG